MKTKSRLDLQEEDELLRQWIPAINNAMIQIRGGWKKDEFRYSSIECLSTVENEAELTFTFTGSGLALGLGGHALPVYGKPNLGKLIIWIDDVVSKILYIQEEAEEVVIAAGLEQREHTVRIIHQSEGKEFAAGCRISGFRILHSEDGNLSFNVNGEENSLLVDVRVVLRKGEKVIRNTIARNWMTGKCSLTGVPAGGGYTLEVRASGWETQHIQDIDIITGQKTVLPPLFLHRKPEATTQNVSFPRMGQPIIRKGGESFRVRLVTYKSEIRRFILQRRIGPAVISRSVTFIEDTSAAFYYEVEGIVALPDDMPEGLYDIWVEAGDEANPHICNTPQCVYVVNKYPKNPVFMTFGHLDTWGQEQAEYLEGMVELANVLAPDMVLISNEVNPAYVSGALSKLQMPYILNFGNHQLGDQEKWFGEHVSIVDFGPDIIILNFGLPWHTDLSKANSLFLDRNNAPLKIINAFEYNVPIDFLDQYRVKLVHDAHGPGKKVQKMGSTPTQRVGKVDSSSFRLIRFKDNEIMSCTYLGDEVAPIPFERFRQPPVQVHYEAAFGKNLSSFSATITNQLQEAFPQCVVHFVVPNGMYSTDNGVLESQIMSDCGKYCVVSVRLDVPASGNVSLTLIRCSINDLQT